MGISFIALIFGIAKSGVKIAYKVDFSGVNIATVDTKSVFDDAVLLVGKKVEGKNVSKVIEKPKYSLTLALSNMLDGKEYVCDKIIDNCGSIVTAYKAKSNGKEYIYCCNEKEDAVEEYLSKFDVKGAKCSSEFVDDIDIQKGYFLLTDVDVFGDISGFLASNTVKTVADIETCVPVDYNTVTVKTSELVIGTQKTKVEGLCGTKRIVEQVTYLNGVENERVTLSDEILTNPQDKVILVGTAIDPKTAKEKEIAHNSGFVFPLPSKSWKLGDGFGAGRNHKGVDLLANYGTPIFAVKSGTVIRASWYSGYGNCVDIDHGNGLVTRYGHASSLCVSVGQKVEAGDIIALVGSTGNSRGNHVHFEVILNKKNLNPLPYINLD